VLSVDRLIGAIEEAVHDTGGSRETDIVFSSDNGYHMGEYRLKPGKMTAFDTDVNVPLVVQGPHVLRGHVSRAIVQNIDLAPTFEALAGLTPARDLDGRSLVPLLRHDLVRRWTSAALVEHRGPVTDLTDPDYPQRGSGNPPTYEAIRTARYTYVEYRTGDREYYDRVHDPLELHNIASQLSAGRLQRLHDNLLQLTHCAGVRECTMARSH
jgi:arylsulfatase A-like enzyme